MNHPHQPAQKSLMKVQDFLRGDEALSGGESKEHFIDFMRWSGGSGFSFNALKNQVLTNPDMNHAMTAITQASKILGTQDPKEILEYLMHGRNTLPMAPGVVTDKHPELNTALLGRGLGEFDEKKLLSSLQTMTETMTEELQAKKKTQKTKTTMAADEKDAVSRLLQFGRMLPASQKESELTTMLEELNQELTEKQTTGAPIEELQPLMA